MGDLKAKSVEVQKLAPADWARVSREVHAEVHGKDKPAEWDRIDYALLATVGPDAVTYVTVRETDHESVYWQFGGAFKWARKSIWIVKSMRALLDWQLVRSKRVVMLVENTNLSMLRLALASGLLVRGIRTFRETVLLEMAVEKHEYEAKFPKHVEQQANSEKAAQSG